MRIGELAARAGTSPSTIRFYERRGLLPEPARTSAGYRQYGEEALGRIAFIQSGQAVGLTLAELREIIDFRARGVSPCRHVTRLIEDRERQVAQRIAELEVLGAELRRLSARARQLDPRECSPDEICQVLPHRS
ncbi:heavy metal-responsive transcriptional regulator [Nocardioides antri]|uniref:Heavy metal-responsive transcriptional regulator n=1 Tax=Nocardioides antri TaxID=2607659 RepID=A0A5B1M7T6_9ACTN|nr:heavy metal-responsive transcriptional regulator [Nocardioides antri]KAA1428784.1 heavy metal-responsive transcriptional regulator [Nocardioides antri]